MPAVDGEVAHREGYGAVQTPVPFSVEINGAVAWRTPADTSWTEIEGTHHGSFAAHMARNPLNKTEMVTRQPLLLHNLKPECAGLCPSRWCVPPSLSATAAHARADLAPNCSGSLAIGQEQQATANTFAREMCVNRTGKLPTDCRVADSMQRIVSGCCLGWCYLRSTV